MEQTKPWYKSRTIWAAIVTLISTVSAAVGIVITPDEELMIVEGILTIIAAIGAVATIWGRFVADARISSSSDKTTVE
jgi:uncharacterized membrane protein